MINFPQSPQLMQYENLLPSVLIINEDASSIMTLMCLLFSQCKHLSFSFSAQASLIMPSSSFHISCLSGVHGTTTSLDISGRIPRSDRLCQLFNLFHPGYNGKYFKVGKESFPKTYFPLSPLFRMAVADYNPVRPSCLKRVTYSSRD